MKILFVADLHGCKWKYDALLEVAQAFQADVIVNDGDMLPKEGGLTSQEKFITGYLATHFARFETVGIYYLCYLGNDDLRIFDDLFDRMCARYDFIISLAQRKFEIEDFEFIGLNWVVDYPFLLKDRCRMDTEDYVFQEQFGAGFLSTPTGWQELEDWLSYAKTLPTIEDELNQLVRPRNMEQSIYIIHMPPHKVGLDEVGRGTKVGSKAVYDFLLKHQPKLALHGHIHESPEVSGRWHAKLGKTICIQPGQLEPFTYVTIDLETMKFERHKDSI